MEDLDQVAYLSAPLDLLDVLSADELSVLLGAALSEPFEGLLSLLLESALAAFLYESLR